MREINTIEVERYEKTENANLLKSVGMKSAQDVFDALEKHLKEVDMLPDEYFNLSFDYRFLYDSDKELPDFSDAICHTNWGGSEGIYIDIYLRYREGNEIKLQPFATGKTLGESGDDFLRMSRIAAECSMMLNGRGALVRVSEQEKSEPSLQKIECKFEHLMPGFIGHELDVHFAKNGWKLERWEAPNSSGYQVFFGENVQVDNNFEYGFPYLFDKEEVIAFAEDFYERNLSKDDLSKESSDFRSITVLTCTHEHRFGIDTNVSLHPDAESALKYANNEATEWFEENKCGQDQFNYDISEQKIDISKFAPVQVAKEHEVNTEIPNNSRIYEIYQTNNTPEGQEILFMRYDWLVRHNQSIDISKYNLIYSGEMSPNETLDDIYTRFNIDHPEDFRGHSLSLSDVVAIRENGTVKAYFVDSIGFKEIPDFFKERRKLGLDAQIQSAEAKSKSGQTLTSKELDR